MTCNNTRRAAHRAVLDAALTLVATGLVTIASHRKRVAIAVGIATTNPGTKRHASVAVGQRAGLASLARCALHAAHMLR